MLSKIQDIIDEIKQQLNDAANSHPGLTVIGTVQGGLARIEGELKEYVEKMLPVPDATDDAEQSEGDDESPLQAPRKARASKKV